MSGGRCSIPYQTPFECAREANRSPRYLRKQPWSTYAVFQTTLFQWSFIWDCTLICLFWLGTQQWSCGAQTTGLSMLLAWMLTSKFIKLMGHYTRYPADFLLLPVSILFGYAHGFIKARAMLSLNVVGLSRPRASFAPALVSAKPGICR